MPYTIRKENPLYYRVSVLCGIWTPKVHQIQKHVNLKHFQLQVWMTFAAFTAGVNTNLWKRDSFRRKFQNKKLSNVQLDQYFWKILNPQSHPSFFKI